MLACLVTHSDSGFTKEQEKGYGVRAANHLRAGISLRTGKKVYHFLQAECKGHRRVTRSTYSSELQAAVDAADEEISLALAMEEIAYGPQTVTATREKWDATPGTSVPVVTKKFKTELVVDAMSLFKSVAAVVVREPAEKSCGVLLFWLREVLEQGLLTTLRWCDTRDLSCDGNTKGSIPRDALVALMEEGRHAYEHATEEFSCAKGAAGSNAR